MGASLNKGDIVLASYKGILQERAGKGYSAGEPEGMLYERAGKGYCKSEPEGVFCERAGRVRDLWGRGCLNFDR